MSLSPEPFRDLFHSHIIPDILSEHLHLFLVEDIFPRWNPFYVLPLVSRDFWAICNTMRMNIFGLRKNEGGEQILSILYTTREYWYRAKLPPLAAELSPILDPYSEERHTHAQLVSSKSLIQVYICTAIAQTFFKYDIQRGVELNKRHREQRDGDMEVDDSGPSTPQLNEEAMHRVYLPLTCAMQLCDDIRPIRLAYTIAEYLATILPRYALEPVLLKYAQDLDIYVTQKHKLELSTWAEWTDRTLDLIKDLPNLLRGMRQSGKLVKSFSQSWKVPWEDLRETNITAMLQDVLSRDTWGSPMVTEDLRERAMTLLDLFDPWNDCEDAPAIPNRNSGVMGTIISSMEY